MIRFNSTRHDQSNNNMMIAFHNRNAPTLALGLTLTLMISSLAAVYGNGDFSPNTVVAGLHFSTTITTTMPIINIKTWRLLKIRSRKCWYYVVSRKNIQTALKTKMTSMLNLITSCSTISAMPLPELNRDPRLARRRTNPRLARRNEARARYDWDLNRFVWFDIAVCVYCVSRLCLLFTPFPQNEKKHEPETEDPVRIAIRLNCKPPPNNYRTCFHRAVNQSNKLGIDVIQEAFPFTTPFVDEGEELVHGSLHLSLAQYEIMNITCEDILAMEMIGLRYLDVRKNVRTSCHLLRPLPVLTHHRL